MSEVIKDVTEHVDIDYKDLYIRLLADYDNHVKRTNKTITETTRIAQSNIMNDVVMVIYNDLCCAVEQNIEGAKLLLNKMCIAIEKSDYDVIDKSFIVNNLDGYFDTDYCEAISVVQKSDDCDINKVVYVTKVGLYDKIKKQTVVHAQCIVAN